jgi:KaiC/GvpD/RAD55 family RecA-like ATPase
MARKSKPRPAYRQAHLSNQALIENLITTFNIVGPDANGEIMSHLLRQESNLDCIIDDGERAAVAEQYGWEEPTDSDRLEYIEGLIKNSTSAKGKREWSALVVGNHLTNRAAYHKLRNQRLREQIRQVKKKVETAWDEASRRAEITGSIGGAEPTSWEDAEDEPIIRIATGHPKLDSWFGRTIEEVKRPSGKVETVETAGIARGFSYAVGAPKGMGKTRLMVRLLQDLCGPRQMREDGVEYGGGKGLYIQAEETMGMFRSLFLRGVWSPGEVDVEFSGASMLDDVQFFVERDRPEYIVIDSKDMIHEFTGPDGRVREGMLRFNELLANTGTTAFIISHVAKSSGDLKGSSMFGHMARAVIVGEVDEHSEGRFGLKFTKNRAGETRKLIRWRHGERSVELDEGKVIKSKDKPDLTRLGARDGSGTPDVASSILAAIEQASGRPAAQPSDTSEG